MTQQSHSWAYTLRKAKLKKIHVSHCSLQQYLQGLEHAAAAAVAAAKSRQSCPTLCNPIEGSPPGSPVPGILQARTLEGVAISFSNASK